MLSLKTTTTNQVATNKTFLLDLPRELLRSILDYIYCPDDLFSTSLVSKGLRNALLPILYSSINLTFTTKIQRNGETILGFLSNKPHLQQHVRQVIVREPPLGYEAQESEFQKFEHLSVYLRNLREIRICASHHLAFRVLALPFTKDETIRMKIVVPSYEYQYCLQNLLDEQAVALTFRFYHACLPRSFGLRDPCPLRTAELGNTIGRFCRLRSLSVVIGSEAAAIMVPRIQSSVVHLGANSALPALQELHLEFPVEKCTEMDGAIEMFLTTIPWTRLQRLSLTGIALVQEVLHAVRSSLSSLSSLCVKAMSLASLWSRHGRPLEVFFRTPDVWFASKRTEAETAVFIEDHPLDELMLEGFGLSILVPRLLSPKLRKLSVHLCELLPVPTSTKVLQAAELRTVVAQAPNIEHLELDIGRVGNLWHSTAVPGVDVDVRIYQILDAIATLPHLKRLRLFPRYREVADTPNFETKFTQPLTDDAAVRLFRKLKEKSASLETLAISSDNNVAQYITNFDPMSWELRAAGEKIILTVRQANRDYEQRQAWVGERRLTTEIRRFSYRKPYIPEFEGWIMEC